MFEWCCCDRTNTASESFNTQARGFAGIGEDMEDHTQKNAKMKAKIKQHLDEFTELVTTVGFPVNVIKHMTFTEIPGHLLMDHQYRKFTIRLQDDVQTERTAVTKNISGVFKSKEMQARLAQNNHPELPPLLADRALLIETVIGDVMLTAANAKQRDILYICMKILRMSWDPSVTQQGTDAAQ